MCIYEFLYLLYVICVNVYLCVYENNMYIFIYVKVVFIEKV